MSKPRIARKPVWIALGVIAVVAAAAGFWWGGYHASPDLAGTAATGDRQPASAAPPGTQETKRPERVTPPPGRFF